MTDPHVPPHSGFYDKSSDSQPGAVSPENWQESWNAIVFVLNDVSLVASMRQIDAVIELPPPNRITPLPFSPNGSTGSNVPAWIEGVMNHRGRLLTIVDVEGFLASEAERAAAPQTNSPSESPSNSSSGLPSSAQEVRTKLLVPPGRSASLAFKVSEVVGWQRFSRELPERGREYIKASVRPIVKTAFAHEGGVWGLVDLNGLITRSLREAG